MIHDLDLAVIELFVEILSSHGISLDEPIECRPVTGVELRIPEGEYALLRGKEFLLSCAFRGSCGQVFTVAPRGFRGRLKDVIEMGLKDIPGRSILYAVINAVAREVGLVKGTQHCSLREPELCGRVMAEHLLRNYGASARILHIGYQPSHVRELYKIYRDNLLISDLEEGVVWSIREGRLIYDGMLNRNYILWSDVILVTASAIVNGTIWGILLEASMLHKDIIVYGVSARAPLSMLARHLPLRIEFFCPYSK